MKNLTKISTDNYEALYDEACKKGKVTHNHRIDGKRVKKSFDRSSKEANRRLSLDADLMA